MESQSTTARSSHAPYGKACVNCVRAKAKCTLPQNPSGGCERCVRLSKICQPAAPLRKTGAGKRPKSTTKVARLEEKLDGLVSLIKASQHVETAAPAQTATPLDSPDSFAVTPPSSTSNAVNDINHAESSANQPTEMPIPVGCGGTIIPHRDTGLPLDFDSNSLSVEEADEALELFRSKMLLHYPIVFIPPSLSSVDLRAQSPFLWLCVMAVSSKSYRKQISLGIEIRRTIARRMLLDGEISGDLLWGLLVYAAWCQYCILSKSIITNIVQLAVSQLSDLGWNRRSLKEPLGIVLELDIRGGPRATQPQPRTLDERRAAIACYSNSQSVSNYWQRTDTIRWTSYFDECLDILSSNEDNPGDIRLSHLVRIQLIMDEVKFAPWHDDVSEHKGYTGVPALAYADSMSSKIAQAKQKVPPDLQNNEMLNLFIGKTELMIYEISLFKYPLSPANPDSRRLELLWTCLQVVKSWFETYLTISPTHYLGLPMFVYSALTHNVVALYRLSGFEHPGWSHELVRESCNMSAVVEQCCQNFALVKPLCGLDPETRHDVSFFAAGYKRANAIKQWYELKFKADEARATTGNTPNEGTTDPFMDFTDDNWLGDLMNNDDYRWDAISSLANLTR